ncbi:MAG: EAL domain-containing protein [Chloroflexota bacterium]|nr:EAL domain-containing protein [Chloroflexota bacterium]
MHTAERPLEEQVRFQAQLLEQVDNAVIATDRERRILFWNAGAERLYGWPREDVLGRDVRRFLPYSAALSQQVETNVLDGVAWSGEIMHRRRDGVAIWVSATDSPILDADGRVIGGVGVSVDVSDRREAREALARSDARFRALVQNSSDAIAVIGPDTTLLYASPATAELLGTHADDLLATRILPLVHPGDRPRADEALARILTSPGADVKVDLRIVRADGTCREVEIIADNRLADPAVNGIVLNARDITDRKRAFSMLEMQNGLLDLVARGMPIGETLHGLTRMLERNIPGSACSIRFSSPAVPGTAGGAPGVAARTRQAVVIEDLRLHPGSRRWREETRRQGYLSCWAYPAVAYATDELVGVLVLYFESTRSPTASEVEVIEMAKSLIVVAVERARQAERLAYQALHDPLTALPNRLLLSDRLDQALARGPRTSGQVGVIFLDLDDFKSVNDSLGHAAGDRLLVTIGERLAATVRSGDTVARFGGDEFVILCEALSGEQEAIALAKRVLRAVAVPVTLRRKRVRVTGSVGVAMGGRRVDTGDVLLREADAAMYRAKERGRDRVEIFDAAMHQRAKARLDTEAALSAAIEGGQLRLHYQPQVSLVTGETVGVEALVRWQHPQRGLLAPAEFIAFAEESGLIVPLGEWVLREAVAQVAAWQDRGFCVPVCVNVSARQLMDPSFHVLVESLLQKSGLVPSSLAIEVTESVLVEEAEPVSDCIRRLIELGATISIDDFGTGYSSLLYLKRFPASMLKIDMSFVHGLENPRDQAIVRAVAGLAKDLGITTVAEGVETEAQAAVLRSLGCEAAQGYLFARPADAEATWAWMRRPRLLVA